MEEQTLDEWLEEQRWEETKKPSAALWCCLVMPSGRLRLSGDPNLGHIDRFGVYQEPDIELGTCRDCGEPARTPQGWFCQDCKSERDKEAFKRSRAKRKARNKEERLCVKCMKRPATKSNTQLCFECRQKNIVRQRELYRKKKDGRR